MTLFNAIRMDLDDFFLAIQFAKKDRCKVAGVKKVRSCIYPISFFIIEYSRYKNIMNDTILIILGSFIQ